MKTGERETFLADIITTAVEGGINYWAEVTGYQWGTEFGPGKLDGNRKFAKATVRDAEADDAAKELTTDKIATAVGKVCRGEVKLRGDIVAAIAQGNAENDAGYIDADAADCLVQIALLGELVYG